MAGINKRACRSFFDPALSIPRNNGLLCADALTYIVRTAIRNISGSRLLVLYFYDRKSAAEGVFAPVMTMFQSKDDFATLVRRKDDSLKWRMARFDFMMEVYSYNPTIRCAFYSLTDEERVTRFCSVPDEKGFKALSELQERILRGRLKQRIIKRETKVLEKMNTLYALPQSFQRWVRREVLPHYVFYQYRKGKKGMAGFCTACGSDVIVTEARHNKPGACPHCKRSIQYKAAGRATNVWDRTTTQICQRTKTGNLVLRIVKAHATYRDHRNPDISLYENSRIFVRYTDDGKLSTEDFYYSWNGGELTNWKPGLRPRFSYWQPNFEAEQCGYLYPDNLDKALAGTPWQYSQLKEFAVHDGLPLQVEPYLRIYPRYPFIEYLVKLGLTRLAAHVVYHNRDYAGKSAPQNLKGKNLREILGVEKADLPVLQEVNPEPNQLILYRDAKATGIMLSVEFLRWFGFYELKDTDVLYLLGFVKFGKLMRYIEQQFELLRSVVVPIGHRRYERRRSVVSEYRDYLHFCEDLEFDLTDEFILFPRNLMEAHDRTSDLMNKKKIEQYTAVFKKMYGGLVEQYQFAHRGLMVLPPKTPAEVVEEGNVLHHCVGGYAKRVANGECIILFVRREDSPDTPFYTMELRGDAVIQVRGERNGTATTEVNRFVEMFKRQKLLPAMASAAA